MNENNQIIIYQTEDGQTQVDVRMENDTVWLTQAQMSELFGKDQSVIARHIANVFKEGGLEKESNMQILHNTLSKYKPTAIYNLDVIISVGYRVKSQRGVKFLSGPTVSSRNTPTKWSITVPIVRASSMRSFAEKTIWITFGKDKRIGDYILW